MFIARGGRPIGTSPHYFVLGESEWYRNLGSKMSAVRLSLHDLPPAQTSVTFPDRFMATGAGASCLALVDHRVWSPSCVGHWSDDPIAHLLA